MYHPIISVIMNPSGSIEYISKAIDSVQKQTYPHWELIIVHADIDIKIRTLLQKYSKQDSRIQIYKLDDIQASPPALITAGLSKSRGEWICFLSDEDTYTQDRFATLIEQTFTRPDIQMFHTSYIISNENQSNIFGISLPEDTTSTQLFSPLSFMRANSISLSSIFIQKEVCSPLPHIPANIKYAYLLNLIMSISRYAKAGYINTITCHHKIVPSTQTTQQSSIAHNTTQSNTITPYDMQFDIGTICTTLLHQYTLKELVPYLSSDTIDIYLCFVSSVLSTALSPQSLVYSCGINTLLLERLLQWIANESPEHFRNALHEHASNIILSQFSSIPPVLQEICSKIIHKSSGSYDFSPEPLRIILARSGAEILRTNPSIAMLYMNYCQKTVPDIYSNMLIYFHDAPVQNTANVLQRPIPTPIEVPPHNAPFQSSQSITQ